MSQLSAASYQLPAGGFKTRLLLIALAAATLSPRQAPAQTGEVRRVHDPVVMEEDGTYWLFSTGRGVPIRRSTDLVRWELAGQVFDSVPAWAPEAVPGVRGVWAPDIARFNDRYHLYYSLSTFGKNRSAIGLATNATLDPASPRYRWVDRGPVVRSTPGVDHWNAIDPNVVLDERGDPWLSWGSFWGGIKMRRLDASTGLPSQVDTVLYSVAARPGSNAIEAPFIVRHDGHFYLFVSFDRCCRKAESDYRIVVGRSRSVTGPYVDREGTPMMQGGGTAVLSGAGRVRGPGHNAVLTAGGRDYLVHHFYDAEDQGVSKLQIRPLRWDAEGWPVAGEPLSDPPPPAGEDG